MPWFTDDHRYAYDYKFTQTVVIVQLLSSNSESPLVRSLIVGAFRLLLTSRHFLF